MLVGLQTGEIIALSFSNGKKHDFQLFKDSRIHVKAETVLEADTGYQGLAPSRTLSLPWGRTSLAMAAPAASVLTVSAPAASALTAADPTASLTAKAAQTIPIWGAGLGIRGAALATALSQYALALIMLYHIFHAPTPARIEPSLGIYFFSFKERNPPYGWL